MTAVAVRSPGAELAHDVLDRMLDDFSRPSFRAGAAVAMVSTVALARLGARPLITIVVSAMLGAVAEQFYSMAEDITAKLDGRHDQVPV